MAIQIVDSPRPPGTGQDDPRGVGAALAAFCMWGFLSLYWKTLEGIPAYEQLCFRIIWAVVCLFPVLLMSGQWRELIVLIKRPKILGCLFASTLCISANWYLFIWAVSHNRVLDSSLGYFINPLMNALLGFIVLKERVSRFQGLGIIIAGLGVMWGVVAHGSLPVLALSMALSFSLYGLVRKLTPVSPMCAVFVETLLLLPFAVAVLGMTYSQGQAVPTPMYMALLALAGPFTLVPMLLFNFAVRTVRLMVLGLAQYISPTIAFFLGIFVFGEALTSQALITFAFIWAGLFVFTFASWRAAHPPRLAKPR